MRGAKADKLVYVYICACTDGGHRCRKMSDDVPKQRKVSCAAKKRLGMERMKAKKPELFKPNDSTSCPTNVK